MSANEPSGRCTVNWDPVQLWPIVAVCGPGVAKVVRSAAQRGNATEAPLPGGTALAPVQVA